MAGDAVQGVAQPLSSWMGRVEVIGNATLYLGDCTKVIFERSTGFDACVTDPPYHLQSIHKRFAERGRDETSERYAAGPYGRHAAGFMGKKWDGGDIAFQPDTWDMIGRALKPGAHLLAFGGTRGFHRIFCAIEDAGFEIRDCISWLYGSGFPKSHNLDGDWDGWGTALKPAWEPVCVARKPLTGTVAENVLQHGTGAINVDACRVATDETIAPFGSPKRSVGGIMNGTADARERFTQAPEGRWPANVIHDGSDEVTAEFPDAPGQMGDVRGTEPSGVTDEIFGKFNGRAPSAARGDSGSAARFFYCAKASKEDRGEGNNHPTVKPSDLMRYLCRLVTPPNGIVLDPFMGSGSTGVAAVGENFRFVGVEQDEGYFNIACRRIKDAQRQGDIFRTGNPL